jgi:hypothetical protein
MERFLKFKDGVTLEDLRKSQSDNRVIILRKSQATNTIQVKVPDGMSSKEIKHAFGRLQVRKVYNEFPYPTSYEGFPKFLVWPLVKFIRNLN